MASEVIFHSLVQRDVDGVIRFYTDQAGDHLADRFFELFLHTVDKALNNPEHFHPLVGVIRRANIPGFPYHFLYRKIPFGIRVLVMRHDKRHPSFGIRRR